MPVSLKTAAKTAIAATLFTTGLALQAQAQMTQQPWTFSPLNRASIATLMKNEENGGPITAVTAPDTIICGSGSSQATANANAPCIIMNNATGEINVGQESDGDQFFEWHKLRNFQCFQPAVRKYGRCAGNGEGSLSPAQNLGSETALTHHPITKYPECAALP